MAGLRQPSSGKLATAQGFLGRVVVGSSFLPFAWQNANSIPGLCSAGARIIEPPLPLSQADYLQVLLDALPQLRVIVLGNDVR